MHFDGMVGAITDLETLPGNILSLATAINSPGQITGISYDLGSLHPQAFLWQGGVMTPLGMFSPNAINDAGNVAGTRQTLQGDGIWYSEAVVWNGATISGLGTLGGDNSFAHGINVAGDVVGVSQLSDGITTRAFVGASGPLSDLGTLGGSRSHAYAINDQRHVVGVADTGTGIPHAFLFKLNEQLQVIERIDLGELGGGNSYAFDINEDEVVVGTSDARAFVWKDNSMSDLNALIPADSGWRLDAAKSVNNTGWIAGCGKHLGLQRGFLLIPIGEAQVESFEIERGEFVNGGLPELRNSDNTDLSARRARATSCPGYLRFSEVLAHLARRPRSRSLSSPRCSRVHRSISQSTFTIIIRVPGKKFTRAWHRRLSTQRFWSTLPAICRDSSSQLPIRFRRDADMNRPVPDRNFRPTSITCSGTWSIDPD